MTKIYERWNQVSNGVRVVLDRDVAPQSLLIASTGRDPRQPEPERNSLQFHNDTKGQT